MRNWVKGITKVEWPIGFTLERTPENILLDFTTFETRRGRFLDDYIDYIRRGEWYAYLWLLERGIKINILEGRTIRQHLAAEAPEVDSRLPPGGTVRVKLGRKARSAFPGDAEAAAWADRSTGGVPDAETNDLVWMERYLEMPEAVAELRNLLFPGLVEFSKQLSLHIQVQSANLNLSKKNFQVQRKNLEVLTAIEEAIKKFNVKETEEKK